MATVNRAAFSGLPVGRGAAIGRPFWLGPWWYQQPDQQHEVREAVARAARGEQVHLFTDTHDGHRSLRVDLALKPVLDSDNKVVWILAEATGDYSASPDQDELQRINRDLEQRIAERTERMRMMIESSAEAVVTIDRNGLIEEWNQAAECMFGWPHAEVVGLRLSDVIIPHRYREAHEAGMQRFLATGKGDVLNRTIELSALKRSGDELPIELSVWPVPWGGTYLFSAFLRDITERKQVERAAAAQTDQALRFRTTLYELARMDKSDFSGSLRTIFAAAADALGLERMVFGRFDQQAGGVILRIGMIFRAASRDTAPDSALGAFDMNSFPQYYAALMSNRPIVAHDAWTDPNTSEFRRDYLEPLGITSMLNVPVWLDGHVVAVVCHEHIGPARQWTAEEAGFALSIGNLVALTLEAASRAQAEAELRQAEADVRQALVREQELNELKSRFVSMTSHEFRTPLTAILSSTEMLEAYGDRLGPDKRAELHGMIKTAVRNMTGLLDEVLFIGKSDTGHLEFNPTDADVDAFCEELLREIRTGVGRAHHVAYTGPGHRLPAHIDAQLLRQILTNLLSNGIKFSPKGSTVTLTCDQQRDRLCFEVTDQGLGIPPEDQANLFSTFHRARNVNNIQGTGLGLAIVRKCVDLHGGEISFSSELGRGTRFRVLIPVRVNAA